MIAYRETWIERTAGIFLEDEPLICDVTSLDVLIETEVDHRAVAEEKIAPPADAEPSA